MKNIIKDQIKKTKNMHKQLLKFYGEQYNLFFSLGDNSETEEKLVNDLNLTLCATAVDIERMQLYITNLETELKLLEGEE